MKEVELKVLDVDPEAVRQRLRQAGARRTMTPTLFHEYFFRVPGNTRNRVVRLRLEGERALLTVKTRIKDRRFKVHREIEVAVPDLATGRQFLEGLGMKCFRERQKYREEYRLGRVKAELDFYPGVRPYLEVEGPKAELVRIIGRLGFSMRRTSLLTATEVIRGAGLDPDKLLFTPK